MGGGQKAAQLAAERHERLKNMKLVAAGVDNDEEKEEFWDSLTIRGTNTTLEKSYFRLTSAPDPATVRPQPVLEKALLRLKTEAAGLIKVAPTTEDQAALLLATQRHLASLNFPKDNAGKGLVQQAFKSLFLTEVVDIDAFEAWRDDESEEREAIPGKIKTLTQTTDFFSYLDTVDDDDDDDEDED